jgi:hypothetical protein
MCEATALQKKKERRKEKKKSQNNNKMRKKLKLNSKCISEFPGSWTKRKMLDLLTCFLVINQKCYVI